ncbi:mucin-2 isoform X2 [Toxorhynchites rutilus septentrionalis]|uniref:mucin-2 isoform X2 n=1 Tax=Toxorhynchites rutilus septentrionalis TaxID=329112 RepID=UPI002479A967|nr:mucin-2 isoform X2 [Toxorhynchites rutilus septentrionalis]
MSSKPLRGTVRWSPQQRYIASSATNALLLTSLTVFLSNLLSPAHGNPLHPFSSSLSLGRNLRHLPCVVRSSGAEGICMFAIDCFKANGTHLGVCIDKIFFGSCCQVHDDSLLFNHEITDNSIDQNHSSGMLYQHFPSVMDNSNRKPPLTETRLPTVTMPKNVTRYELVSTSSTTTHRTTVNRRNSTTTLVTTTTKPVLKDEIPTSTEYQEFSTFQYVQSSKNPDHSTTEANRPTAIKPVDKNTSRKPPVRNSTKPYRTRRPTPNRNGTRRPIVQTTTPKVTITTLPEVKVDSTSRVSVTRRPTTTTESTSSATNASTASSTTVRRTTISSRKPTTTSPVEEIPVAINAEKPAVSIAPLTRPTIKRRPTTQTTIAEPETTMAPRPRPVPTSAIVTVAATSLDHLIEDLVTTTILHTSSPESTTQANVTITVPVTTIRVTETDKPTSTVASSTRRSTTTTKPTTTTTTPVSTTSTSTTTVTRKPTTTSTTLSSRRPTTTSATTTTTTTRKPTTSTTNTTTKKPTSTTTTTTRQPTTTSTATTTRKPTTTTTGTTTKSTTPTTAKITTTTTPKTTTVARITPPAEVDYRPETSQTHHQLDETTAGFGLVTWTSIVDNGVNDRLQAEQGPTTSNSWILIHTLTPEEVFSTSSNQTNNLSIEQSSSATLTEHVSPMLSPDIILPPIESLLPEAAYIYTIQDETNDTQSGSLTLDSQTTTTSTTEVTSNASTDTVEEPFTTITSASTIGEIATDIINADTTTTSTTTSTTTPTTAKTSSSSATSSSSVTSMATSSLATLTIPTTIAESSTKTVEPSSTTEGLREVVSSSTAYSTTSGTTESTQKTSTTVTVAGTTTSLSSTTENMTTSASTDPTKLISSSTLTDSTTPQIVLTTTQQQPSSAIHTSTVSVPATTEQEAPLATSSSIPEISVEISGPTSPSSEESYTTQTATAELSTVEYVTDITVEESGSVEEGSGSEEESGEEEEEASYSSESYESTSELIQSSTPEPTEQDKFINTTTVTAGSGIAVTTPESTTMITLTTLNITGSMQSIASMFNISSSTGMPVRFPEGNTTTGATNATTPDSITMSPDFITTSTVPSLEGIDYRAVCGKRMFPEPRIVGGTKAAFGRWPWQISLRQWRTSTYLHKCGAALLNENWAITAAHCVDNVPPSDLLLRLGEYDLALEEEPYGYQERRVQIVASHPQFDPRTFEYDLALLRFYEPVQFQPNIIPVCVPGDDENHIGRTAFVTGWGRLYEDGPLPSVLQEVTVPVIENKICETMYRSAGYIEHIPHIFICAGWKKGGYDSCEGDSGGPMVIQRSDKRFQLAGVISWGIGCAEPNQPGVYTRISEFRDWINQILQF